MVDAKVVGMVASLVAVWVVWMDDGLVVRWDWKAPSMAGRWVVAMVVVLVGVWVGQKDWSG